MSQIKSITTQGNDLGQVIVILTLADGSRRQVPLSFTEAAFVELFADGARAALTWEGPLLETFPQKQCAANNASNLLREADGLRDELANSALRSADHLRRAIKAEAKVEAFQARQSELLAVLARLCELNATERPMAKVWSAAQALVDSHKGAETRKPCTCDGAGRGPGRACVVKTGGRLGELWRCSEGCNGCDDCVDYEA